MGFDETMEIVISDKKDTVFTGNFACVDCRNFAFCNSADDCKLYKYIQQRIPGTTFNSPRLITVNTGDYSKDLVIVRRAIRLRGHKTR